MNKTEVFHVCLDAEAEFALIRIIERMGWTWSEEEDRMSIIITHPEEDANMVEFICGEFM